MIQLVNHHVCFMSSSYIYKKFYTNYTYIFTNGSERPLESMAASPAQRFMPTVS